MESYEILAVVDSVSTEKGIDKDLIFKAIEVAIASASQRHFHEDADLYVEINRETGEYQTHRNWIVFDETNDEFHHETHVTKEDSGLDIGDTFSKEQEYCFWSNRNTSCKTGNAAKSQRSRKRKDS